ncbi:ATP-dependent acyl-CoA ligase [Actinomadura sp. NBRC 104412]|uniref:AMP-binding protein n=1 Tax=Actinomadura sp. NBRC 104412 TaxID=3032203 RepID=UPI0024A46B45|nr:AMP-binding protein [Actinomadura sp. NBRC 104412]GLZ09266.1 ATP-dependent acyl-CoA ligase [Actinomadura sp. NBRC 104412]
MTGPETATAGTITAMLAERAEAIPDAAFLRTADGDLTYAEAQAKAATLAGSLRRAGVRPGTTVALLMHNSLEQVIVWFALARLGAVHVPVNTALVGARLVHVLRVAEPAIVVVDDSLQAPLADVLAELESVRTLIVHRTPGGATAPRPAAPPAGRMERLDLPDLIDGGDHAPVHRGDDLGAATMLFTSGTTGVSKACVLSHRYLARQGQIHAAQFGFRADDVLYSPFPLFHVDAATLTVVAALSAGATAALGRRFSASRFWDEVRAFDASVFNFMGATLTILWKREPTPADRDHRVRLAWGVPMPDWRDAWERRFGFPLFQVYGLTDAGVPVYDPIDGTRRTGTCGRVIDPYEVRIAPLAPGASDGPSPEPGVGEILVRGREPGLTMTRYHGMPEATAETIDEDGWVRTGDLGSLDPDGYLTFHGRRSDSIRRRGENISAYEVEQLVDSHPAVLESAAVGVPSELTEEDVKVCVVLKPGAELTPDRLHRYCRDNAPAFMVPRYIEFVDALPKTPTEKVEKFHLKRQGVTPATWDAERAG